MSTASHLVRGAHLEWYAIRGANQDHLRFGMSAAANRDCGNKTRGPALQWVARSRGTASRIATNPFRPLKPRLLLLLGSLLVCLRRLGRLRRLLGFLGRRGSGAMMSAVFLACGKCRSAKSGRKHGCGQDGKRTLHHCLSSSREIGRELLADRTQAEAIFVPPHLLTEK